MGYFDDLPKPQSSPSPSSGGFFSDLPKPTSETTLQKVGKVASQVLELPKAGIEAGLSMASGGPAWMAGGMAGAAGALVGGPEKMKEWEQEAAQALTYEPRTEGGKAATALASKPFEYLDEKLSPIEGWVTEKTGSPEAGWAAKKGAEGLLFYIGGKAGEHVRPMVREQMGLAEQQYRKGDIIRDAKTADQELSQLKGVEGAQAIRDMSLPPEPQVKMWEPWQQPQTPAGRTIVPPTTDYIPPRPGGVTAAEVAQMDRLDEIAGEPWQKPAPGTPITPKPIFSMEEARRVNQERFGKNPPAAPSEISSEAVKISEAMKVVESGGDYKAVAKDQGTGAYQFMPDTWKQWSKEYLKETGGDVSKPLEMSPGNQDTIAQWKVQKLLDEGYNHKQIASIWNSGSPKWEGKVGVNKYNVKYAVPAHVEKVDKAYKALSKEDADFIRAVDSNPAKAHEAYAEVAREMGVDSTQYIENRIQNIMADTGKDYPALSKHASELLEPEVREPAIALAVKEAAPVEVPQASPVKTLTPEQTQMLTGQTYRSPKAVEQALQALRQEGYELPPGKIRGVGKSFKLEFMQEPPMSKGVLDWLKGEEGALHVGNLASDYSKLKERFSTKMEDELITPPGTSLMFSDPLVEARFKELSTIPQKDLLDRALEFGSNFTHDITEHHKFLNTRNPVEARVAEAFRQSEAGLDMSTELSRRYVQRVVGDLSPQQYDLFRRRVVVADVVRQAASGEVDPNGKLHFGLKNLGDAQATLQNLDSMAAANPQVAKALQMREQFMGDLLNMAIDSKVLPEALRGTKDYFHRETAHYVAMERMGDPLKKRTGKVSDPYTDFVESEYRVVAATLYKIEQKKLFEKIGQESLTEKLRSEFGESWREHIPEGYTEFKPSYDMRATQLPDAVMEKLVDETLTALDPNLTLSESWVIPKNVAKEIEWRARQNPMEGVVARTARYLTGKWKQNALYNPLHVIKYTLNNLSGDVDAIMAYNPRILSFATQAGKDVAAWMKGKALPENLRLEFEDTFRKGILNSGMTRIEIPEAAVQLGLEQITGRDVGTFRKIARAYANASEGMNTWRENTLRLAAYRHFKNELAQGKRNYGASRAVELDALHPEDRAAKLARDLLGDYGNISVTGQHLRKNLIPFWSWMEINTPRYFRLLSNMSREGAGMGTAGRVAGVGLKRIATNYVKFAVTANVLSGAVQLWNHTMFPDLTEAFNTESQRNQQHIIVGRHEDGSPITFRFQGALSDVMGWIGMPNYINDFMKVLQDGDAAALDLAEKAPKAFGKKILDASVPILKGSLEALGGQSYYPDPTSPRPIRDRGEHLAGIVGMKQVYSQLAGKPSKGLGEVGMNLLGFYSTDLGQNAYYQSRDLVQKFADKINYNIASGGRPSDKSNAVYYFKKAMSLGDKEAAKKYLREYINEGGTNEGFKKSVEASHPMGGIPKKHWGAFLKDLQPADRKIVADGVKWYQSIYGQK